MKKEKPTTTVPPAAMHREFTGVVMSDHEDKTIHVLVKTTKTNEKYRKQYVTSKKYAVHDEKNEAKAGDMVVFRECRPLSKTKKWLLVQIVK